MLVFQIKQVTICSNYGIVSFSTTAQAIMHNHDQILSDTVITLLYPAISISFKLMSDCVMTRSPVMSRIQRLEL